jgi:hypothetical protein
MKPECGEGVSNEGLPPAEKIEPFFWEICSCSTSFDLCFCINGHLQRKRKILSYPEMKRAMSPASTMFLSGSQDERDEP